MRYSVCVVGYVLCVDDDSRDVGVLTSCAALAARILQLLGARYKTDSANGKTQKKHIKNQKQALTLYSEAHKPLWNTLSKIDSAPMRRTSGKQ